MITTNLELICDSVCDLHKRDMETRNHQHTYSDLAHQLETKHIITDPAFFFEGETRDVIILTT